LSPSPGTEQRGPYLHERFGILVCALCRWTRREHVADVLEWARSFKIILSAMNRQQWRQQLLNELVDVGSPPLRMYMDGILRRDVQ
jgi:hypothetical protein